ncbi:MAG: MMPL family transporter [Chitinophagales bacterium]|nr:MMPL family transporter [Chitinophagales bacterium]
MFSLRYPYVVVLLSVLIVGGVSMGIFNLKLKTDGRALLSENDFSLEIDKDISLKFGTSDKLMVVVQSRHKDGIFNDYTFLLVNRLSNKLREVNGINPEKVLSLTTLQPKPKQRDFNKYPHFINFNILLDDFLKLKRITYEIDFLRGFLISLDGNFGNGPETWAPTATIIFADLNNRAEATEVIDNVKKLLKEERDDLHVLFVSGNPVAETALGGYILKDLSKLIPLSILFMAIIFFLRYRSFPAVLLPLSEVGACLIFVFGLMGILGIPIYITIIIIPVILTAIGISDEVHVLNCYSRLIKEHPESDREELISMTFKIMSRRVILTSVTTSIGFSAFVFSPILAVKYFGIFTAVGILFCMLWTLLVIPSLLSWIPKERFTKKAMISGLENPSFLSQGVQWVFDHKKQSLLIMAIYMICSAWLTTKVEVWDSWQSGFSKNSEIRKDVDIVNKNFYGTHQLLVKVKLDDRIENPGVLNKLEELESYLETLVQSGEGGVYRFTDQIEYLYGKLYGKTGKWGNESENLEVLQYYGMVLGERLLSEQVNQNSSEALIRIFLREPDYLKVSGLMSRIEEYSEKHQIDLEIGGDVATSQSMITSIVDTQLRSLIISIALVFLLTMIFYRSLRLASVAILPPVIAIVGLFAMMGAFGIPLGVATSMFASIIIGIGVDFSIHWIESMKAISFDSEESRILKAIKEIGPAFVLDSVIVAIAFGFLLFSAIPSNSRLGLFIISGYLLCFLAVIFLVPLIYIRKN